jgi:hypothetical protein
MTLRLTVISEIQKVASEQKKTLAPLTDDLLLLNSGLDSLCFAILVARLEDVTGVDPFTDIAVFPESLGDFISLYVHATGSASA